VGFVIDALGKIDSNVPFMMPERLARTDPNEQIKEVVGSGPFRFVANEWVPGAKVVYEKFAGYVPRKEPASQAAGGKVVKVDRVELIYMPEPGTAVNALVKGEVDLLESPSNDLLPVLERASGVKVAPDDPLGYQLFLVLNHVQPPFDDEKARQALLWGTKQSEYLAAVSGEPERWQECPAMFGCGTPDESRAGSEPLAHFDLEKAKALLKAGGYDGRPIVVMDPTDNSILHPAALVAAETLKRMGAAVDAQAMDWSTLTQRRASKAPAAQGGWNAFVTNATVTGIANPLLNTFAKNCEQAWIGWPCDQRIVELTRQWTLETDRDKRRQIDEELQRLHLEAVTYVPLGQYRSVVAYRNTLKGILPGPALFYWNVEKE
jgi:peptide/nickel transport system substrate-binding protein